MSVNLHTKWNCFDCEVITVLTCPECFAELDEYQLGAEELGDEPGEQEPDPFFDDPLMAGFVTLVFFGGP